MGVQHVVLFNFPTDLGESDWAEMQRQVRAWPHEIGGMTVLRLGASINAERTRGYQYLLFMEFADEAALTAYQQHPVHLEFLRWILDRDCTPLAFDYYLDESTVVAC
ncbi:MAG TPA: Dabb family protein [Acidimicrobiales bacterium]|nr:Dabb family protein [Acidimicrobiales bacterium]